MCAECGLLCTADGMQHTFDDDTETEAVVRRAPPALVFHVNHTTTAYRDRFYVS